MYFYVPGTTTPKNTYQDVEQTILNPNPVVLNARGGATIWGTGAYRQVVYDQYGNLVWDRYITDTSYAAAQIAGEVQNNLDKFQGDLAGTGGALLVGDAIARVANIASLRAMTPPSRATSVQVDGYYASGDGGGGTFAWAPTDTTADNGGTIIAPNSAPTAGRWIRLWSGAISVRWFGAKGDYDSTTKTGTNDRLAIRAVIDYVQSLSGRNVIRFDRGVYLISGLETVVQIPQVQSDLSIANSPSDAQLYIVGLQNTELLFDGAGLVSDKTNGGYTLLFDAAVDVVLTNPDMQGATVMSGSTATTVGTSAIGFLSLTKDSSGITIRSPRIRNHYGSIVVTGDPAAATRVRNIAIDGALRMSDGEYGIALYNNGDNFTAKNCSSLRQNRPFFIYGVQDVAIDMVGDSINGGFQALIKAYQRNTRNINVRFLVKNRPNNQARLGLQSQHNPAIQPTPAYLENINIEYDESNAVAGQSILFSYYQNSTLTATSAKTLFSNVRIFGKAAGSVATDVQFTNTSAPCNIDVSQFAAPGITTLINGQGFIGAPKRSYTPALTFGGNASDMTGTYLGEYFLTGGLCYVSGRITLTNKGASVGSAEISLPIKCRSDMSSNPTSANFRLQNVASINSQVIGYLVPTLDRIRIRMQGATTDAEVNASNFTSTSVIDFSCIYPI